MKPFKLNPIYKNYIWGGDRLTVLYNKITDVSPVAESWELSCHKDGVSVISGGEYDGVPLDDFIRNNPAVLGRSVSGNELPILIKLIDAADNLSVQVHPSDDMAMEWEGEKGKTEMWYVAHADDGARITFGVAKDLTQEELATEIKEKRLESVLNSVPSKKGDVFFVEAGTVHAIGKGNVIIEIQQNSNITYRLYDYGRVDKSGKERELHIEKGVKVARLTTSPKHNVELLPDGSKLLCTCPYFAVKEVTLSGTKAECADEDSYNAIVVAEGKAELLGEDISLSLRAGETVFVPANFGEYTLNGKATYLLVYNPS